jgi:hypothetical protein
MITYTSTTGFQDFGVDGTAVYWVDNTQAINRVRRLSRALGAGMTTVISVCEAFRYSHSASGVRRQVGFRISPSMLSSNG